MLGFTKERRVVRAIVEADHFQVIDVVAFEQVERGGGLAECPQLGQRQAEDLAQDHAVDRIVRDHQQGVVCTQAVGGARQTAPAAIEHLTQRLAAGHQYGVGFFAPCAQACRILVIDFACKQPFPFAMGDFLQVRIGLQQACACTAKRQRCGGLGTREWRCHCAGDLQGLQTRAQRGALPFADR